MQIPNLFGTNTTTASIKKPIHNVKEARISEPYHRTYPANRYSSSLEKLMVSIRSALQRSQRLRKAERPPPLMRRKPKNADAFGGA